jgi:hypothetical protein
MALAQPAKPLGQKYGVAKQATLVIVAVGEITTDEMTEAFEAIAQDLKDHPERRKRSVVTMSMSGPPLDPSIDYHLFHAAIKSVMDSDVPVVVSAGNWGKDPNHKFIDTVPAIFARQDRNYPLIVVGSVDKTGHPSDFSQLGETISAVGEDTTCLTESDTTPKTGLDGTSFCKFTPVPHCWHLLPETLTSLTYHSSSTGSRPDSYLALIKGRAHRHY